MSGGGWARLELTDPLVQLQSRGQEMVSEKIFLLGQGKVRVFHFLYYYMRNFCNLIGLEQWYFSLI